MKPRILLIEDIPDNATLIDKILSSQGYDLLWAKTAEDGLEMATAQPPRLILLDLGLPDMDGQTLVGYLRNIPALMQTPIVVVTAWPEEMARRMVTAYGCDGFLCKPINVQEFIRLVQQKVPLSTADTP